jgi:hypothetical protein
MRSPPGAAPREALNPGGHTVSLAVPDPPRAIPRHRALGIALRTAHLIAFGTLLGGHVFAVDPPRLVPFLAATIATGLSLMALELASTCAWLFTGAGLTVLVKLGLLLAVPVFWEQRVLLLVLVVIVASVGAHMPSRFRHRDLVRRRPGAARAASPGGGGRDVR